MWLSPPHGDSPLCPVKNGVVNAEKFETRTNFAGKFPENPKIDELPKSEPFQPKSGRKVR